MHNQTRSCLPYARMMTTLLLRLLVKIKSSELYKALVKQTNINAFICMNVLIGDGGKYTYVDAKRRKRDEQAQPLHSSSNALQSQQEEDHLAYVDDIELPPSHEEKESGNQTSIGGVTLNTISQHLSNMHWSIQRVHSHQDRLMRNQ